MSDGKTFKRAQRLKDVRGFGIDRLADAADARARTDWPVLRMENLDTDLPLPPEAIPETIRGLETPEANSWLPFTGDRDLRAAVSDFLAERTGRRYDPEREILITSGGTEAILDVMLATVDPGDEVLLTDPTYAGIVNRARLAGGTPRLAPYRVEDGEWRLDLDAFAAAAAAHPVLAVLMSPSMPSGAVLTHDEWAAVCDILGEHDVPLLYDAAMERLLFDDRPLVHPLHFDGMADRTVIAGSLEQGAPHDRLARRLGGRAGGARGVGRLDARLQHDHADRRRPRGRHRGAARRPGPRRRRRRRARAPARHHHRRARRLAADPPGRRLVAADRRRRARHHGRRALARADRGRRHRGDADDGLGRRGRRPARAARVQRRARRAPARRSASGSPTSARRGSARS